MALQPSGPTILSEEIPHEDDHYVGELELSRPMGGPVWWNSLLWTNFPPLTVIGKELGKEGSEMGGSLRLLNSRKFLSDQYITFAAARDDLCQTYPAPKDTYRLTVECMQYEGVRDVGWNFPLQGYIPKRDNHQPHEIQARRFYDNNVVHFGLSGEDFSEKVMPVSDLDACITIADYAGNPTWGYYHCLLRVNGWPFRVKKMGTFEGFGPGGHQELNIGLHHWADKLLWDFIEGEPVMAPTGPDGAMEVQKDARKGSKYWAQLMEMDWLGPKRDERAFDDPEVPPEKGYVWFTHEGAFTLPTGRKAVKVKILDEGVVPAWLDLNHMRVFAGGVPLGFMSELVTDETAAESEDSRAWGRAQFLRTITSRKVVVENAASRIVFDDPLNLQVNDFVDLGWALFDSSYQGAQLRLSPKPGKWAGEVEGDRGLVGYKASGPPPICHGEGPSRVMLQEPKSDFYFERRLVM